MTEFFRLYTNPNSTRLSLWGFVKCKVYETCPVTILVLKQHIRRVNCENFREHFTACLKFFSYGKGEKNCGKSGWTSNVDHFISNSMQLCIFQYEQNTPLIYQTALSAL